MIIREATASDIPEIIAVLKASIGESKLPKTAEIWKYKHFENPFGASYVIIAVEAGKIIGVRAFMQWIWKIYDSKFSALRAVDTGVIPGYQGKGVFRALNSAGLDLAKTRDKQFIYNTPNSKSLPANLKMGWQKIGEINITLMPGKFGIKSSENSDIKYRMTKYKGTLISLQNLCNEFNSLQSDMGKLFTPKSPAYLEWRYENNPLQTYEIIADGDFYLAAYIKKHKYFTELRIAEHIFLDRTGAEKIRKAILRMNKHLRAEIISYTSGLDLSSLQVSGKFGPVMVWKPINLDVKLQQKQKNIENWSYMLGDLELF